MTQKKVPQSKVNPKLDGFELEINSFGEIVSSLDIDKVNRFLDEHVEDKKLKGRNDKK
ncbi:hypothetical protein [Reichenbachiella sp. 5M10]|uniref:hypothetical protein n=1 Tax=Reichenbachiella sp. 5M10 TaxID=1889772 RepID=UPI001618D467|nr:hypothetical protein [Reichenbachiella sp. 5M10]